MITNLHPQFDAEVNQKNLIGMARRFFRGLGWLSPAEGLISKKSRDFGRSIEASLNSLSSEGGVMRLQLRQRDAAVVMSIDHYEDVVRMKVLCAALIERVKEREVAEAANEYEALYNRITSKKSRQAADALFAATSDDLRKSYQPGRTESH